MSDPVDPVALTSALVKCPSVTPEEGGALVLLEELLSGAAASVSLIWAPAWQKITPQGGVAAEIASALAAVPVATKNTSAAVSKTCATLASAARVTSSLP